MDPRLIARAIGAGRIAVGLGFVAAPKLARAWIGPAAQREDVGVALRAFGVRDLVLGGLAVHTASKPQVAARMAAAGILVDAVDLAATVAARRSVPATGIALVALMAGGAIAGQAMAYRALRGAG
ncbi:MAG: hypothetical protein MSC31_05790 [Solirubrobacteraceae bacterium MAG38_C4-C5]|nr:hypothetical protein [Candidatus Siliceabacter maunaloa]